MRREWVEHPELAERIVTVTGPFRLESGPVNSLLLLAAPVSRSGELRGIITAVVDLQSVWDTVLRMVETQYNNGVPARAIGGKADMSPLEGYAGYDKRHIEIMTRRIYSLYRIGR